MSELNSPKDQMQAMSTQENLEAGLETINQAVGSLASEYHQDWRQTRLQEDGSYEPRVKPTTDESWTAKHDGATEVDIANTEYEDLPADWQEENKAAAEVVVDLLLNKDGKVDLTDEKDANEAGKVVHDAWLSRNEWAKGGDLDKPFEDLPEDEKTKDLNQVKIALELFDTEKSQEKDQGSVSRDLIKQKILEVQQLKNSKLRRLPKAVSAQFKLSGQYDRKDNISDGAIVNTPEGTWVASTDTEKGVEYVSVHFDDVSGENLQRYGANATKNIETGEIEYTMYGVGYKPSYEMTPEDSAAAKQKFVELSQGFEGELASKL